jgi:hypothetical protein
MNRKFPWDCLIYVLLAYLLSTRCAYTALNQPQASTVSSAQEQFTATQPTIENWFKQSSVHLRYQLSGQLLKIPYTLPADMYCQFHENHYKIKFEISHFLLGTRLQISDGQITPDSGLLPNYFSDKIKSEDIVTFNYSNKSIQYTTKPIVDSLEQNAQDQLSIITQLGYWIIKNQNALSKGDRLTAQVVSKNNVEKREFQYLGNEILDLPFGRVDTFKIIRVPRSTSDQKATVWLLKNTALNLARIRLEEENGSFVDQKLIGIDLLQP